MKNEFAFPAFPVTGWQVGAVDKQQSIVVKFGYSTSPYGPGASTFDSQFFSLTPDLVRSLIYDLQRSLTEHEIEHEKVA